MITSFPFCFNINRFSSTSSNRYIRYSPYFQLSCLSPLLSHSVPTMYISNPIVVIFLICLVLADQLEQQRSPDWDGLSLSQEEAVTDMLDNDSPRAAKEFLLFRQRHKGQPLSLLTVRYCWCTWWYGRCCCCTPPIPSTKTTYSTHFAPSFTSLVYLFLLFCFIKIIYRFCLEGGFLFFLFY